MSGTASYVAPECDGVCLYSADVGVPGYGVAYAHPGCPLHDPDDQPAPVVVDRCPECRTPAAQHSPVGCRVPS